jgi:hypothetical protein
MRKGGRNLENNTAFAKTKIQIVPSGIGVGVTILLSFLQVVFAKTFPGLTLYWLPGHFYRLDLHTDGPGSGPFRSPRRHIFTFKFPPLFQPVPSGRSMTVHPGHLVRSPDSTEAKRSKHSLQTVLPGRERRPQLIAL